MERTIKKSRNQNQINKLKVRLFNLASGLKNSSMAEYRQNKYKLIISSAPDKKQEKLIRIKNNTQMN